ncbi:MAG: aspartate aminotransferase family protein [Alphaproteobacteria bacterium]|nr:aspartate aminotransferase family protein [Alphaproteobacteria bacterium]
MSERANPKAETLRWQELDHRHHLHPFTDYKDLLGKASRIIVKAEGVYLWDSEGEKLLDGMAGLWCVNLGYGRKELAEAAYKQMLELPYYNTFFQTATPPPIELAKAIAEIAPPGLDHVFFANSGSEANDSIVKIVCYFWKLQGKPDKSILISRDFGYHGVTMAAASLSGLKPMHPQFGLPLPGFEHIETAYWWRQGGDMEPEAYGLKAAQALEAKILALGPERVGAFIGEPVHGAGGLIVPPMSYWPEIARICRKYDVLLISDEVICGFGRTGAWFGCQTFGFTPDIMTIAKGLSSGYVPISGVVLGPRVADALNNAGEEFVHGFTYSGHPTACAVALENIRLMRAERVVERVHDTIGPYFQRQFAALADHPLVGEVRGKGLLCGIELTADKKTRRGFEPEGKVGLACRNHCFRNGLIMRASRDVMLASPPLIIKESEVYEMVTKFRLCLDLTLKDLKGLGLTSV